MIIGGSRTSQTGQTGRTGRTKLPPHRIKTKIIWWQSDKIATPQKTRTTMGEGFLPQGGGYKKLRVYQVAEMIYDLTYHFAHRFLRPGDRTIDQMVQAARSGKQNIAEGSAASMTSRETEIKLTNVAKASLEELLVDYKDYLRVNGLTIWDEQHPRYSQMREYAKSDQLRQEYTTLYERMNGEEYCNLCITLINQATYMLKRLIDKQQQLFVEQGGIREQMTRARLEYRKKS